jgi:hypothetical protein
MSRKIIALGFTAIACACTEPTTPMADGALSLSASAAPAAAALTGELVYGLTSDGGLITFYSSKPNQTVSNVSITGTMAGESVIGIDFRPSDLNGDATTDVGKLYAVTDASRLYVISAATGAATFAATLSTAINGTAIGFGFNPTVDRIRVHTDANQNLRINPDGGATTVDGALAYTAGDPAFGQNPDIGATAYTNNDNDPATGTALYAIDAASASLVTFTAATGGANGGQLTTVGSLGVAASTSAGFDISASSGTAYAVFASSPSGKSTLYSIDLATGTATKLGMLAQTSSALLSIAIQP